LQSHFYSDFKFIKCVRTVIPNAILFFLYKTSTDVSEARYWHVKCQFLPTVHMTKLYYSAVYTVNPSLLPAILLKIMFKLTAVGGIRQHWWWQIQPTWPWVCHNRKGPWVIVLRVPSKTQIRKRIQNLSKQKYFQKHFGDLFLYLVRSIYSWRKRFQKSHASVPLKGVGTVMQTLVLIFVGFTPNNLVRILNQILL